MTCSIHVSIVRVGSLAINRNKQLYLSKIFSCCI
uniref:Uncharacterized protein n=1 Tax=Siphoviridae sp. ctpoI7 TaxID=2825678 RepID=A0A8S5P8Q0_9CAUD|nr:MAG TPA: hypothetical protein [Siphoviridae sp. ctpoI7]